MDFIYITAMNMRGAAVAASIALRLWCRRETEVPLHYAFLLFKMAKVELEVAPLVGRGCEESP